MLMEKVFEDLIISDIIVCSEIYSSPGTKRSLKNRSSFGLIFSTCGKIDYHHNNAIFSTDKNHFILVPKGATYYLTCEDEDISFVINFESNLEINNFYRFKIKDNTTIEIAKNIIEVFKKRPLGWRSIIRGLIYHIISIELEYSNHASFPNHINQAIAFIYENYENDKITNEVIAQKVNISSVYLQKEFVKYLKTSPHKFLVNFRINQARILLSSTYLSISEIAEKIGFASIYDFSRSFKKANGISPLTYRKKYRIQI